MTGSAHQSRRVAGLNRQLGQCDAFGNGSCGHVDISDDHAVSRPADVLRNMEMPSGHRADDFHFGDAVSENLLGISAIVNRQSIEWLHLFPQPRGDEESISELLDARQLKAAYRTYKVAPVPQGFSANLNHLTLFQSGNGARAASRGELTTRAVCDRGLSQFKTLSSQQRGHEHG